METAQNPKKCRAVFGLEQQQLWRKKKCIRYQHDGDDSDDSDGSPGHFQGSPDASFPPVASNQSSFDALDHPASQSSSSNVANSITQSGNSSISERLSPNQSALNDQIKQEKSPPLPNDANAGCSKNGADMFHPPTSTFRSSPNDSNPGSSGSSSNFDKKRSRPIESSNNFPSSNNPKSRDFNDPSPRYPASNMNGFPPNKPNVDARHRRANSHSESPLNNSRPTMFNSPLLSPTGIGMNPPHSTPRHFLPQLSYLAATLPTSPLGSLMGFPGFKGLASPMGMGLNGGRSSVPPGGHPGSSGSRHTTSALEGKS